MIKKYFTYALILLASALIAGVSSYYYFKKEYMPSMYGEIIAVESIKSCDLVKVTIQHEQDIKDFTISTENPYLINKMLDAAEIEKNIFIRTNKNSGLCKSLYGYEIRDILVEDSYEALIYKELKTAFIEVMEKENE